MLSDLLTEDLVQLNVVASNWEDVIRKSAQPLVDNKKVTEGYVDDIITGVTELGPYIVITEHVALPHARPESGALESAVGITVLKDSVEFGSKDNDPVKFLFPLAAKDSEGHLSALQSSMMLKIKIDQVIKENDLPIETEHGNLDSLIGFNGDLVITMSDLTDELNADDRVPSAVGITNIVDKAEMKEKLTAWLAEHNA